MRVRRASDDSPTGLRGAPRRPRFFLIGDTSDDKSARTMGRRLYGGYLGSAYHG